VRERAPKKIIVAVPTASLGAIELLAPEVDENRVPQHKKRAIIRCRKRLRELVRLNG
jgi:predicted phosphoribosyltransferase